VHHIPVYLSLPKAGKPNALSQFIEYCIKIKIGLFPI